MQKYIRNSGIIDSNDNERLKKGTTKMLKNPEQTKNEIVEWIRDYFKKNGPDCDAVVGVSGGKDSSVVAALLAEALGKDRVVGVMMPNGVQSDISDSQEIVSLLGIKNVTVNIKDGADGLSGAVNKALTESDTAQALPNGGRVVNTCNRSEDYIGYSTKYGDAAGDFSPLANLLVHEVIQIGEVLGIPERLTKKAPSDGLSGMTDEDKIGFTYATLDHYVLTGECEDEEIKKKIDRMHAINLHKLQLMPTFKLEEHE